MGDLQIINNYSMGYAPQRPAQPQNRMRPSGYHAADYHAADAQTNNFQDEMDYFNTTLWSKSDGWANDVNVFDCGWQAGHVNANGKMVLTLDNTPSSGRPYTSGEFRSNYFYGYGTLEASIKAVSTDGVVVSLFLYRGPWDEGGYPGDEIDIEFVRGRLQTNYAANGVGGHETLIDLGFDPSQGFHTYKLEWLPNRITWYVDGMAKHTEDGSRGPLPSIPGRIIANLWPGTSWLDGWAGHFNYTSPVTVQYDWIKYTPTSATTATTPTTSSTQTVPVNQPIAVPNPFSSDGVWIAYPSGTNNNGSCPDVAVKIYNISGEMVRSLDQTNQNSHQIKWDGKNSSGNDVSRGMYVAAICANGKKPLFVKLAKN